eukprot:CAMPEP_0116564310 /NCGR_PEP_ID=MMETSP0397-20121206/13235_1 /TAXON_ID=216820 /ORGANISM="Cyclophora tenuis, Strain ECT3854" /LENGTH=215 /DNA_ID=CAMNT_0004090885 /DNA_START=170 /DNA_END=817 /DNA_ORIENTATION=+
MMGTVLSDLLQLTMQRMVSSVPLSDLVRKVTTENSGSRLGELREMIESLLSTYGHELEVFSGAVAAMQADIVSMEKERHKMKLEGASVQSVMQQSISQSTMGPALVDSYARSSCPLMLDGKGDATFRDGGRLLQNRRSNGGLATALDQLLARRQRNRTFQDRGSAPKKRASNALPAFSLADQQYYNGASSEAALHGKHRVRALGEAQSYGSLHWI